nr:reductive dehalogenase [uncultured bacterium]
MSNFHNTVSRRNFMKMLGLTGAGLGAASAAAPVFHDLDEVNSSAWGNWKRPWYVKERDFGDPTVEVNWDEIQRYNMMDNLWMSHSLARYLGPARAGKCFATSAKAKVDGVINNTPGQTLRDLALEKASYMFLSNYYTGQEVKSWLGPQKTEVFGVTETPEELGVPKWEGTPEENLKMLRAAMRFYGVSQIGVTELNERERKLISTTDVGNFRNPAYAYALSPAPSNLAKLGAKEYVFEDVDKSYEGDNKFVIPNKPLWVVSMAIQMSKEMFRHGLGSFRAAANGSRYRIHAISQTLTQNFLRGIGYQGMGYPHTAFGPSLANASAILSGLAEMGRNNNYVNSPEFGSICGYFSLITDLPLTPTPPIDAGMWRFCHTCKKCAEVCPAQGISYDSEPSWEVKASEVAPDVVPLWSTPGKRTYHTDSPKCGEFYYSQAGFCGTCMGNCVFNTNTSAMVHDMVKATLSTTGLLNGFLWNADKAFGYGITPDEEKESWWDMSLPLFGQDGSIGATDGGY